MTRTTTCERRRRQACGRENLFQFARTHNRVDFGNVLADLVAKALDQASCYDQFLCLAAGFVGGHFEDRIDRLLLGALDKRAGVDYDHVGVFRSAGQLRSCPRQQAHHHLAIHEILGAAQANEAHLLRAGWRILRRFLFLEIWLEIRITANGEVFYGHAILLF